MQLLLKRCICLRVALCPRYYDMLSSCLRCDEECLHLNPDLMHPANQLTAWVMLNAHWIMFRPIRTNSVGNSSRSHGACVAAKPVPAVVFRSSLCLATPASLPLLTAAASSAAKSQPQQPGKKRLCVAAASSGSASASQPEPSK